MTTRKTWFLAGTIACLIASLVAGVATFLDWRVNPSGLFHGADGTDWSVVGTTFASWFLPTLLVALLIVVPALLLHRWWSARTAAARGPR